MTTQRAPCFDLFLTGWNPADPLDPRFTLEELIEYGANVGFNGLSPEAEVVIIAEVCMQVNALPPFTSVNDFDTFVGALRDFMVRRRITACDELITTCFGRLTRPLEPYLYQLDPQPIA